MGTVFASLSGSGALVFLILAFLVFALSTFQWRLGARFVMWLVGAGLIALVLAQSTGLDRDGLFALLDDAQRYPADGAWVRALEGNQSFVFDYLTQLQDLFVALGAFFGLAALLALLPGEFFDRLLRPVIVATAGAAVGALITVQLVAVGLGGYPERNVYVTAIAKDEAALLAGDNSVIVDGDTFKMGALLARLAWVDAPEFMRRADGELSAQTQIGFDVETGEVVPLGADSRAYLANTLADSLLVCEKAEARVRDRWGRALLECDARWDDGEVFDVALDLVEAGHAAVYPDMPSDHPLFDAYFAAQDDAIANRRGMWATCTLAPRVWRNARDAVSLLRDDRIVEAPEDALSAENCATLGYLK